MADKVVQEALERIAQLAQEAQAALNRVIEQHYELVDDEPPVGYQTLCRRRDERKEELREASLVLDSAIFTLALMEEAERLLQREYLNAPTDDHVANWRWNAQVALAQEALRRQRALVSAQKDATSHALLEYANAELRCIDADTRMPRGAMWSVVVNDPRINEYRRQWEEQAQEQTEAHARMISEAYDDDPGEAGEQRGYSSIEQFPRDDPQRPARD